MPSHHRSFPRASTFADRWCAERCPRRLLYPFGGSLVAASISSVSDQMRNEPPSRPRSCQTKLRGRKSVSLHAADPAVGCRMKQDLAVNFILTAIAIAGHTGFHARDKHSFGASEAVRRRQPQPFEAPSAERKRTGNGFLPERFSCIMMRWPSPPRPSIESRCGRGRSSSQSWSYDFNRRS